jgi:hypothetical protein
MPSIEISLDKGYNPGKLIDDDIFCQYEICQKILKIFLTMQMSIINIFLMKETVMIYQIFDEHDYNYIRVLMIKI